jgi:carbamoyltransferase
MSADRKLFVGHANSIHDPAIAVIEGDRVFAEAIERHTQCKRSWEMARLWYSARPLRAALARLGVAPVDAGEIFLASTWSDLKTTAQSCGFAVEETLLGDPTRLAVPSMLYSAIALEPLAINQLRCLLGGLSSPGLGDGVPPWAPQQTAVHVRSVAHHLGHAAMAALSSPFEECTVLVADGYGEGAASSLYDFRDGALNLLHEGEHDVSLGFLYAGITQLCGFDAVAGEEWKMMGLAAYGRPRDDIYTFFSSRMIVDGLRLSFRFAQDDWPSLERMIGGFRHAGSDDDALESADLAHNFQRAFEDTVIDLVKNIREVSRSSNLAFTGGCALNSSLNGKLVARTGFERLHVPCAPADDGNALGAALYLKHVVAGEPRHPESMSPYLGSFIEPESIEHILSFGGTRFREAESDENLCDEVADLLASGCIVGWVQGRAEFGPRALGNRSILADPRQPDMKQRINDRVKFRELYRPLAPSILHEHGSEYFEGYQESPYMERTLPFRPQVRDRVPAVVHVDGTGRLQSVKESSNPLFHRLIRAFFARTGVPMLLNTSFNVMGKPIIHSAEDAMTVFYTTGLDRLVIGRYILEKRA